MRRLLLLVLPLACALPAVPAVAAPAQPPPCTKRLVFVAQHVRVARSPAGGRVACQHDGTHKRYRIGSATGLESAGPYLTFLAADRRLVRLDVRTGDRLLLERVGPAHEVRLLRVLAGGDVAWASIAASDRRLRVWDQEDGQVRTLVAGADLDPESFAFSGDSAVYWTQDDGSARRTPIEPLPFQRPEARLPRYVRGPRPACAQNIVFLRGSVKVVRTSERKAAVCGPDGRTIDLGPATGFVAQGPWLVYVSERDGRPDLARVNVRTGELSHLKLREDYEGILEGLLADGTVAWTDTDVSDEAVYQTLRVWRPAAPEPAVLAHSVIGRGEADPQGLMPGTSAVALDGTVYWAMPGGAVHSARPAG